MGGETGSRVPATSYPKQASDPIPVIRHVSNIYADRLNNFIAKGQYAGTNLVSKLHEATVSGSPHVKLSVYSPPGDSRPTFKEATSHKFRATQVEESFGPSWSTHWFKVELFVPKELLKKEHLEFHWNANNEGMVWNEHGEPLQGLTGGGEREAWILPKSFQDGKPHTFYIEMACNRMFGNAVGDIIQAPKPDVYFQLEKADIVAVNLEARALYMDFWILKDAARELPKEGWQEHDALSIANELINCFEVEGGDNACLRRCRKIAAKYIGKDVDSSKVYEDGSSHLVNAIGHCHIDTCWLWPWAETKRKVARSWSNQCDLMERYPEHRFCCSQAQQFKWLKMYYPSVFDRIKMKVKEGKFQPIGGSWVEHDTNMPSGESLVRQFLYGQRFFESHFGERSRTFWLPDTFGYSSQLPQVCRLAGMDRFFTQKLSWNNINNFPHSTFHWVGIDNSQVLCHMAPAETYTAEADFGDVVRSMSQHKSKDQDVTSILPFGKGDGGGGPTWQQIEKLRRCRGISNTVGQLPSVKVGGSVDDYFERLQKKIEAGTELVSWHGELYLELHRGCYTTQANNKRNNRCAERMLHDIELLATSISLRDDSYKYPKARLDEMWEDVLLMQFHDCLPGSCIEMVYRDSDKLYERVFKIGEKLLKDVLSRFRSCSLLNMLPKYGLAQYPPSGLIEEAICGSLDGRFVHIEQISEQQYCLENLRVNVTVTDGVITSYFDKINKRELVPKGSKANQLVIFDDKPGYWQAWDVEVYHLNTRKELKPTSTSIIESNRDSVILQTTTQISENSHIVTAMLLGLDSAVLEFTSSVSWHETQKFLKVEFPTTLISNTGTASYETQYGVITRPVHYNTSWDMAKFEVVAHRFADLSESNYGLSVLNDSKYGFATVGSTMRLSLLRSPKAPDAHADMGTHYFRYALLPHRGPLGPETVGIARAFNSPLTSPPYPSLDGQELDQSVPLFPYTDIYSYKDLVGKSQQMSSGEREDDQSCQFTLAEHSDPSIVLDAVKRGEDNDFGDSDSDTVATPFWVNNGQTVVLRLYESLGGFSRGQIYLKAKTKSVRKVVECNILEDDGDEVSITTDPSNPAAELKCFDIALKAFEVKTFKLYLE